MFLVCVCLGLNYGIRQWQSQIGQGDSTSETRLIFLNLLSLASIFLTNVFIKKLIFTALSNWARFHTQTKYQKYHTVRVLTLLMLNTTIVPFLVYIQPQQYFKVGGLVNQVFLTIIIVSFATAIIEYFDVLALLKKCQQCKLRKQVKDKNCMLNQYEANLVFEGRQPSLTDIYPALIIPFFVMVFYMPIFPFAGVFTLFGYFISHLIITNLMLRRWKRMPNQTEELALFYMYIVVWMPLFYATTTLYFNLTINLTIQDRDNQSVIIISVVGYIFVILLYVSKLFWGMKCAQKRKCLRSLSSLFLQNHLTQMSSQELQDMKNQKFNKNKMQKYRDENPVFKNENNVLEGILEYGIDVLFKEQVHLNQVKFLRDPINKVVFSMESVYNDIKKKAKPVVQPKKKREIWKP